MKEIDIDISGHHSKHMNEFLSLEVETVITVCGNADQACPTFPGQANRHHWGFDDPAHATGTDAEKLAVFRKVRDEIRRVFEAYASGRKDQAKLASKSPCSFAQQCAQGTCDFNFMTFNFVCQPCSNC